MEIKTRSSKFAGSFYGDNPDNLRQEINSLIHRCDKETVGGIRALVVPHASYLYSGQTAACGYKQLEDKYEKIFLIGLSHRFGFKGIATSSHHFWETPLGKIETLNIKDKFKIIDEAHKFEHSIEVHLPFIQSVLSDFKILPLVTGHNIDITKSAIKLSQLLDDKTLIITSSDLSHYLPYQKALKKDSDTIDQIVSLEGRISQDQACGSAGLNLLIEIAKLNQWQGKLIEYKNSGDIPTGDKNKVVGYSSIVFHN